MGKQGQQSSFGSQLMQMFGTFISRNAVVPNGNPPNVPMLDENRDVSLKIENILLEEFKFDSAYLLQSLQERTATYNLYFVLIGILATGSGIFYQVSGGAKPYIVGVGVIVLIALGVIHLFFLGRLVSIDTKYHMYIQKMDKIREFYVLQFHQSLPGIASVLNSEVRKPYTVPFLHLSFHALVFVLLESFCFAGSAFILAGNLFGLYNGNLLSLLSDVRPYLVSLIFWLIALYLAYQICKFAAVTE